MCAQIFLCQIRVCVEFELEYEDNGCPFFLKIELVKCGLDNFEE